MPVHREKTETPQFGLTVQGSAVAGASVVAVQVAPPNPQQAASTSTESTPSISVWADLAPVLEITPQLVLEFDSSASKRREAMLGKFKAFVMLMERKVSKPIPDTEYTSILYQLSLLTEAAEGLDRLALLGIQKFLMFMPWNGTTVKPLFALARDLTILAQSLQAPSLDILYLALNCLRFIAMRLLWSACAGDLVSFFPLNIEQFITQIAGLSAVAERFPDDCFLDVVTSIIITTVSGLNDREGVRSSLLPAVLSSKPNSLAFLRVEALCESLPFAYQTLLILGTRLRADERVAREYMSTMHRLLAAQELPLLLIPAHIHNVMALVLLGTVSATRAEALTSAHGLSALAAHTPDNANANYSVTVRHFSVRALVVLRQTLTTDKLLLREIDRTLTLIKSTESNARVVCALRLACAEACAELACLHQQTTQAKPDFPQTLATVWAKILSHS
eukprot:m.270024 g.270024  ORF g.270024 m.270024 type:complete len:449 (-) comp54753_c0_seq2:115-1461(-)